MEEKLNKIIEELENGFLMCTTPVEVAELYAEIELTVRDMMRSRMGDLTEDCEETDDE